MSTHRPCAASPSSRRSLISSTIPSTCCSGAGRPLRARRSCSPCGAASAGCCSASCGGAACVATPPWATDMRRYAQVLWLFWQTSLASELEYRLNFLLAVLSSLGHLSGNLFGLSLFYVNGGSLGGWPFHHALIVSGFFTTLQGMTRVLLSPNLQRIIEHVRTGTLDFVLIKPIDTQFWLSTRRTSPWGLPDVAFGLGMVVYAAVRLELPPARLALALGPFFFSAVIQYSLWFTLA